MSIQAGAEAEEFEAGAERAQEARAVVAGQLSSLLVERQLTGDRELFGMRVLQVLEAEREGDHDAFRAAVMEAALAAGAWCVSLDLRQRRPD